MQKTTHSGISWIDFEDPGADDVRYLTENFNIHPLAIEEFVMPTFRPKTTHNEAYLFLTIHIPLYDVDEKTTYPGEVDIVLTRDHLITGHKRPIRQITEFFAQLQESEGKRRAHMADGTAHLLYEILTRLVDSCFPRLDHITRKIDWVEEQIFKGKEKEMVMEISFVKRDILNFRRAVMPQEGIIRSLTENNSALIPENLHQYFNDLASTITRLWNTLESAKETIESLEETNNSLLSHKINEKIRILTIFSAFFIPITLYAQILGANMDVPFGQSDNGFVIHLAIMLVLSLLTVLVFRVRKWTE